jgi:hypothetical protein
MITKFKERPAEFSNPMTKEKFSATIIGENEIEGKLFYVLELNGRVWQIAKDAWQVKSNTKNKTIYKGGSNV